MNRIELSNAEREVLGQLLQKELMTLEIELRHTDHLEFKQMLKQRREVLRSLTEKVPAPQTAPT